MAGTTTFETSLNGTPFSVTVEKVDGSKRPFKTSVSIGERPNVRTVFVGQFTNKRVAIATAKDRAEINISGGIF